MKNKNSSYLGINIGYIGLIIVIIVILLSSCSTTVHSVFPTTSLTKQVVAKDKNSYSYLIALCDGSVYCCSFGEYSIINIGDLVTFKNGKQNKIINIIKP